VNRIPAVAALCLAALGCGGAAAQDLDQRVPATPGGLLQVDIDLGEESGRQGRATLEVRSHDADEVWAVADVSGLGGSSLRFRVEHDDKVVRVYGRAGGVMSWLFGGPGVSMRIWVPREYSLDLRCSFCPIRVEDVIGSVRARTGNAGIEARGVEGSLHLKAGTGSVRVNEMSGPITVRVSEGPVDLEWVTGNVDVRTGEGNIAVRHVDGTVRLRSDSGDVEMHDVSGPAEVKTEWGGVSAIFSRAPEGLLETRRGSVNVLYPGHTGLQLDARSRGGSVSVVGADGSGPKDHFTGPVNGGGPPLRIYAARGTIQVDRR
jgi:hypothetical protein